MNEPYKPTGDTKPDGHGIFGLFQKADPDTMKVLEARRDARADARLNRSMAAMFDEVADRSLNPNFWEAKGIVVISDSVLADLFRVTVRSVYTWKHRIEEAGYFHLGRQPKTNMWPITKYYISCLHRGPSERRTDKDGTYGTGKLRSSPLERPLGARCPGQTNFTLPGSRGGSLETKSEETPEIAGLSRSQLPAGTENNFRSEPKPASGGNRSQLPAGTEKNFRSEPKPASGGNRSQLPLGAEAGCQHIEDKALGSGASEGSFKRSTVFNAQNATGKPGKNGSENVFLLDVACLMDGWRKGTSKAELANSGGWWRSGYRADAGLMRRVLAEVQLLVKEGKIKQTPGQAAVDLWQRWGGKIVPSPALAK
jgi:hypothetical protein